MKLEKRALGVGGIILIVILIILIVGLVMVGGYFIYDYYIPPEYEIPTPSTMNLNTPFSPHSSEITASGIKIELQNDLFETIVVKNIKIENCGETNVGIMEAGLRKTAEISCNLKKGSNFKGDIEIVYTRENSQIEQSVTGRITGKVN